MEKYQRDQEQLPIEEITANIVNNNDKKFSKESSPLVSAHPFGTDSQLINCQFCGKAGPSVLIEEYSLNTWKIAALLSLCCLCFLPLISMRQLRNIRHLCSHCHRTVGEYIGIIHLGEHL